MTTFVLRNQAESSHIYIHVTLRSVIFRKSTGIKIDQKLWNPKTQTVRASQGVDYNVYNARLKAMRQAADSLCAEIATEPTTPTNTEFWERFAMKLDGKLSDKTKTFTQYTKDYLERRKFRSGRNTVKQYRTFLARISDYEKRYRLTLKFEDINLRFFEHFKSYILQIGYTENYFSALIKCLKVIYRDARDIDRLHDLHETEKRGFSASCSTAKTVYLSLEELQRIAEVEITPETVLKTFPDLKFDNNYMYALLNRKVESLNIIRNKFLLGAYTALRVSDFNSLQDVHIDGDYFRVTTQKTGAVVVIPIHPVIRKIIASGFDISTPISDQKINKHIKEVARMAGITKLVEGTKLIDHRAVVGWWPKCDIITTHTARRSAATNMFKAGIPALSIMKITGHTTEKSFMKYIKITAEENAELMAKNKFFMQ